MRDELVGLLEGAGIEEQIDPLARRQLAGFVLAPAPLLAAAEVGQAFEVLESLSREIVRSVPGVVSVTYNITPKPPSTIEAV